MSRDPYHNSKRSLFNRPYVLVAAGFGLGYVARFLLGAPAEELTTINRQFDRPMPASMPLIELPLKPMAEPESSESDTD